MINDQEKYPHKNIGKQLKKLRGSKNQDEFAKELGVAVGTYNRYEKGRRKVPDGLFRLAERLAEEANKKADVVRKSRGLYTVTQELEIDGKKHLFELHLPNSEPQKLPPPDMAVQNALRMIEMYVEEVRKKEVENAELKAHIEFIKNTLKEDRPPDGIEERRSVFKALKKGAI